MILDKHKPYIILGIAAVSIILELVIELEERRKKKHYHHDTQEDTDLVIVTTINNKTTKTLKMNVKQWADANLQLIDHNTLDPIAATFANIEMTSSNPEVATVDTDVNADGNPDIVGVALGATLVHFKADATYIDGVSGESVTKSKETDLRVEISAPPPGSEDTDLVVTLTPAQDLPTTA